MRASHGQPLKTLSAKHIYQATCGTDAYLGIINLACAEQRLEGIVPRNEETGEVDKKVASDVEEDKEKVNADEAEKGVDFRNRSLLFEVIEHGIFRQLFHPLIRKTPLMI